MWFLLFIKQLPVMAMSEIKEVIPPRMKRPHDDRTHDLHGRHRPPRRDGSGALMQGVLGAFHELDSAVHAIEDLKKERFGDITVFTPTPRHEFEHVMEHAPSKVRMFTLDLRSGRRDVRLLDSGLDLGLLAARRRRQADRDAGCRSRFSGSR